MQRSEQKPVLKDNKTTTGRGFRENATSQAFLIVKVRTSSEMSIDQLAVSSLPYIFPHDAHGYDIDELQINRRCH